MFRILDYMICDAITDVCLFVEKFAVEISDDVISLNKYRNISRNQSIQWNTFNLPYGHNFKTAIVKNSGNINKANLSP